MRTILTGESLVNDATALTMLAVTIAAATGGHAFIDSPVRLFAYAVAIGALVGLVLATVFTAIRGRLRNSTLENALGLLLPFAAFLIAEHLHASGVVAVVMAGFSVSLHATFLPQAVTSATAYRTRLQERMLWPVVNALLEAFVFAYMGLQLKHFVDDVLSGPHHGLQIIGLSLAVLGTVVVVRAVWVFLTFGDPARRVELQAKRLCRRRHPRERPAREGRRGPVHLRIAPPPLTRADQLLVAWTGMRGIVTLAAAASIPLVTASGSPFPERETIQVVAFVVVLGTLLGQGVTLPLVGRRLAIDLAAEQRAAQDDWQRGRAIVASLPPNAFDDQRRAIADAVVEDGLDDEVGRSLLLTVDLAQATREVAEAEARSSG